MSVSVADLLLMWLGNRVNSGERKMNVMSSLSKPQPPTAISHPLSSMPDELKVDAAPMTIPTPLFSDKKPSKSPRSITHCPPPPSNRRRVRKSTRESTKACKRAAQIAQQQARRKGIYVLYVSRVILHILICLLIYNEIG